MAYAKGSSQNGSYRFSNGSVFPMKKYPVYILCLLICAVLIIPVSAAPALISHSPLFSGNTGKYAAATHPLNNFSSSSHYPGVIAITKLPSSSVVSASQSRTFTEADNGKTFNMTRGQTVKIALDENPTTGYMWNTSVSNGIRISGDSYKISNPGLMGSGGIHTWTLVLSKSGEQEFTALYKRAWEPEAFSTFTIHFNVK